MERPRNLEPLEINIVDPDVVSGADNEIPEARVETYEVSRRDRILYSYLDKVGRAAGSLLNHVGDKYIDRALADSAGQADAEQAERETPAQFLSELNDAVDRLDLTDRQRKMVEDIVMEMHMAEAWIDDYLGETDPKDVISDILRVSGYRFDEGGQFDPEGLEMVRLPAGIGLKIDRQRHWDRFPKEMASADGFYCPGQWAPESPLSGKIFVADQDAPDLPQTFRHEYLHLLTAQHLNANEIDPYFDPVASELVRKILAARQEYEELQRQLHEAVDPEDQEAVKEAMFRVYEKKREISRLEKERNQRVGQSEALLTGEAKQVFANMRNELSAYAFGGEYRTVEEHLTSGGKQLSEATAGVKDRSDRAKLERGWLRLKTAIEHCRQSGVPAEELLPIFLTSANFETMSKRLLLKQEQFLDLETE